MRRSVAAITFLAIVSAIAWWLLSGSASIRKPPSPTLQPNHTPMQADQAVTHPVDTPTTTPLVQEVARRTERTALARETVLQLVSARNTSGDTWEETRCGGVVVWVNALENHPGIGWYWYDIKTERVTHRVTLAAVHAVLREQIPDYFPYEQVWRTTIYQLPSGRDRHYVAEAGSNREKDVMVEFSGKHCSPVPDAVLIGTGGKRYPLPLDLGDLIDAEVLTPTQ